MICDLPLELQNKIFFYAAEHPCAEMIKKQIAVLTKYERCPNIVSDSIDYGYFIIHTEYFHHYLARFKRAPIVKIWSSILHSINDKIFYLKIRRGSPIHITEVLTSMSYPKLSDIERTWVITSFKIKNNIDVIV